MGKRSALPFLCFLIILFLGLEACCVVTSERWLGASAISEEVSPRRFMCSASTGDFEDSTPQSPAYEELVEVVTHAVARLSIYWKVERHVQPLI